MTRSALIASLLGLAAPAFGTAPAQAQAAQAAADQASARTAAPESFVALSEIRVPIVDAGRLDGVLRLSIVLQARDGAAAAELARRMPELRAAGLGAAIEFARLHASPYSPIDVARLSAMLTPPFAQASPDILKVLIVKVSATAG